jgi:hypothetical protein
MNLIYRILSAILDWIIGPQEAGHETPIDSESGESQAIPSPREGREATR